DGGATSIGLSLSRQRPEWLGFGRTAGGSGRNSIRTGTRLAPDRLAHAAGDAERRISQPADASESFPGFPAATFANREQPIAGGGQDFYGSESGAGPIPPGGKARVTGRFRFAPAHGPRTVPDRPGTGAFGLSAGESAVPGGAAQDLGHEFIHYAGGQ